MEALFGAFGIKGSMLLAQAVNFAIVLTALWYFLYKPMHKVLAERQNVIAKGVEDAHKAEEKLAAADEESAMRVTTAEKTAEEIVAQSRAAASEERTKTVREAEERAAQIARDADARAAEAMARATRESDKEIARLAVLAAEKVIRAKHD